MDPQNRNKAKCNISKDHIEALLKLIKLQRDRKIVIKRCDKGAGIIILSFEEYMHACNVHLGSKLLLPDGNTQSYYTKVEESDLEIASIKLKNILQEGLDNEIISNTEFDAMNPEGKTPGKFYCTFKVHKQHEPMRAPPERPIVSACGSIMENASHYIEHHIKDIGMQHPSFLEDTPDFLRYLQKINNEGKLPQNTLAVTWDVIGLFTNIPHSEGLDAVKEARNKSLEQDQKVDVPTDYIIRIL